MQDSEFEKGTLVFVDCEGEIGEILGIIEINGKKVAHLLVYASKGDERTFVKLEDGWRVTKVRQGAKGSLVSAKISDRRFDKYGGVGIVLFVFREERSALVDFPNGIFRVQLKNLYEKVPF